MLRTQFEDDLKNLHQKFYSMGQLVSTAVFKSVKAFIKHDKEIAYGVIDEDQQINELEVQLEKKSLEMIALQQPVTTDLRIIITVMKASSDLERIGDHAVSVAKSTIRVKGNARIIEVEEKISEMADAVKLMVDNVLDAYINEDAERAKEIAKSDSEVNAYFKEIYDMTIKEMKENPNTVIGGTDYLQVAGFLERIGDYVTNICEWIVYLKTGKILELNTNRDDEID
ncbi:phosphate signaling complex protein PhoU [Vagococcus intermedius]|uniref:Phosphate-specific transport system accessory protein PhoU n=1 Tax=Vagococcus intermedius TaxID=2991418 RepID=A0AAF0CW96_9ENTE|nr:phosphate signaling complex protein PhoU [Vagococcus intermedius]WEG74139.1 phosphate signaling complex protein PhoU [Vagococcus intermedius]WEG76218.1 phosphate signaling complex protein PhoU [Vagococcus intermedius]